MSDQISKVEEREWARLHKLWLRGSSAQLVELARRHTTEYPGCPYAWIVLATCLVDFALYDKASAALRAADRVMPPSRRHVVWVHRGDLFREKGNYKVALKWYRRAVAAQPKNAGYHICLGALLAKQGEFDNAKKSHRRAVKLGTGATDEAYCNLGLIMRAEGNYRQALQYLDKALEIDSGYAVAKEVARDIAKLLKGRRAANKAMQADAASRHR